MRYRFSCGSPRGRCRQARRTIIFRDKPGQTEETVCNDIFSSLLELSPLVRLTCMHSYKTFLAGDILGLPPTWSLTINKRSLKHSQGHVRSRPSSREIEAYAADRTAGVSQHLPGISHSLQDILKPGVNVVQVRRQPPAGIIGLADLLRDVPGFKAQVSIAFYHPCTRSFESCSSNNRSSS